MKRSFTALLALLLCGCFGSMARLVDDVRVKARIGVLADVNLRNAGDVQMLKKTFAYYRQEGVDAVAIAGTVTVAESKISLEAVWQEVFDGTTVPLFTESGRHEVEGVAFATSVDRPVGRQEVLTFYGTRRLALTDELCIYPRSNRAICAGSMSGIVPPNGYESKTLEEKLAKAAQGLLVSVYADKTVIRRLDFTQKLPLDPGEAWEVSKSRLVYAEDVADPWVVAADGTVAKPEREIPEFWPDSRLLVIPGYDRSERIYTVKWPSLQQRHVGARARWYVMEAVFADTPTAVFLSRTVLAEEYHQAECRENAVMKSVIRASQLPSADARHSQVVFKIHPIGAFGKSGKPLVSAAVPLPNQ